VGVVLTPYQAPNANAHTERFVRSIREECLDRLILFGERRLIRTLDQFTAHFHTERNHQGLGNRLIMPAACRLVGTPVRCHERVGWAVAVLPPCCLSLGMSFRTLRATHFRHAIHRQILCLEPIVREFSAHAFAIQPRLTAALQRLPLGADQRSAGACAAGRAHATLAVVGALGAAATTRRRVYSYQSRARWIHCCLKFGDCFAAPPPDAKDAARRARRLRLRAAERQQRPPDRAPRGR
jgi:hypothetical protein